MKSRKTPLVPLFVASLGLVVGPAPAATIHVPADQPTIQQGINAAIDGDFVLVSPGVYFERFRFNGKAISVQSLAGPWKTIIDGSNLDTAVRFEDDEGRQSILAGFTIQHGNGSFGGAISLNLASPTITGNVFRDNGPGIGSGAAIDGNSSSPVVERNIFIGNTCDTQLSAGVVTFGNFSSPSIINNIFVQNPCAAINIGLPPGFHPVIANNTIAQNRVGIRVDARVPTSTQLYANNILIGNNIGLQVDFLAPGREPTWINNLVFLNITNYSSIADQTGLNGNISSDPLFDWTSSRQTFQLQERSPAVDAGTLSVPGLPPTDFLGKARLVDGDGNGSALPDIGAYEFSPDDVMLEDLLDLTQRYR